MTCKAVVLCYVCGKPDPTETTSEGDLVHEQCLEEYEDMTYFREFYDVEDGGA